MKNSFRLLLILLSGIIVNMPLYAQEHAKKKVAVYMTGTTSEAAYKKVIGAKLVNAITESGEYAAVERTEDFLVALSAESDYQTSGEVRDSQIARLGQKFGVRYVVVADASELFDEYFIVARLINVETGLVERAFDINGPADSMAQLVSLSQKVARGLLNSSNNSTTFEGTPQHLALFAMDKYGKDVYISLEQWKTLPESEKYYYTKKGVCLMDNGNAFVVALNDAPSMTWYDAVNRYSLMSKTQAEIIIKYLNPLNCVLPIFGGFPINVDACGYWTNEQSHTGIWFLCVTRRCLEPDGCERGIGYVREIISLSR